MGFFFQDTKFGHFVFQEVALVTLMQSLSLHFGIDFGTHIFLRGLFSPLALLQRRIRLVLRTEKGFQLCEIQNQSLSFPLLFLRASLYI